MRHRSRAIHDDRSAGDDPHGRRDRGVARDPVPLGDLRRHGVRGPADDVHDARGHCDRDDRRDPAKGDHSGHSPRAAVPLAPGTRHCSRPAPPRVPIPRCAALGRLASPRSSPRRQRLHGLLAGDGGVARASDAPQRQGRARRPVPLALRGRDRLQALRLTRHRDAGAHYAHDGADVHYRSCSGVWDHRGSLRDVFPRSSDCESGAI